MLRQQPLHPAVERDLGGRERDRPCGRASARLQAAHRLGALRRDRDRELGGLVLDRVEPVRIGARLLQQPVARAQRALQRVDAARNARRRPRAPGGRGSAAAPMPARRTADPSPASARPRADDRRRPPPSRPARGRCGTCGVRRRGVRRGRLDAGAERGEAERAFDLRRRPPRSRRLRRTRPPRAWRGAGRGPAPETRSPRSGWSCRRRSARSARPGCRRCRGSPRDSCGNWSASGGGSRRRSWRR